MKRRILAAALTLTFVALMGMCLFEMIIRGRMGIWSGLLFVITGLTVLSSGLYGLFSPTPALSSSRNDLWFAVLIGIWLSANGLGYLLPIRIFEAAVFPLNFAFGLFSFVYIIAWIRRWSRSRRQSLKQNQGQTTNVQ